MSHPLKVNTCCQAYKINFDRNTIMIFKELVIVTIAAWAAIRVSLYHREPLSFMMIVAEGCDRNDFEFEHFK